MRPVVYFSKEKVSEAVAVKQLSNRLLTKYEFGKLWTNCEADLSCQKEADHTVATQTFTAVGSNEVQIETVNVH